MYDTRIVQGWIACTDAPEWDPLEAFLPAVFVGAFMWMHTTALEDGTPLQAYKHSMTRRYLLLDDNADAYENLDKGRYRRMRHSDAIEQVFTPSWLLDHAEEDEREALREALAAAWRRGDGDAGAGGHVLPSSPACAFRCLP